MPEKNTETLEVGVLVRNDLTQKSVQIVKCYDLSTPELGFVLVFVAPRIKPRDRGVQGCVHGLMIKRTLSFFGLEINGTEALDLFGEVNTRSIQLALDRIHARRVDFFTHFRAFVIDLE